MKIKLNFLLLFIVLGVFSSIFLFSCEKEDDNIGNEPLINDSIVYLSIDSLVATKINIVCWEQIYDIYFSSN